MESSNQPFTEWFAGKVSCNCIPNTVRNKQDVLLMNSTREVTSVSNINNLIINLINGTKLSIETNL